MDHLLHTVHNSLDRAMLDMVIIANMLLSKVAMDQQMHS